MLGKRRIGLAGEKIGHGSFRERGFSDGLIIPLPAIGGTAAAFGYNTGFCPAG